MRHTLSSRDITFLEEILPEGLLLIGEQVSEDYAHDELSIEHHFPEVVVRPENTDQISKIMKYANSKKIPVVVRGAGTGLAGGCVALQGGIMIDMTNMDQILELDMDNLTVTVQPGVLLMNLQQYVQEQGLFYPPDPGEKAATIGGNISTNAGGMRAVKYGVTRDYVMGLTVILPSGEVMVLGGKVVKNSSGYALLDLVIGSEGTLGVITEATLKLLPLPAVSVSLLIPFIDIELALHAVPKIILSKASLTAIEFMEQEIILQAEEYLGKRFPDSASDAYLLLTFDGSSLEGIEKEYGQVAELCLENGARDVFIVDTEERKGFVWKARGAFLEAIKASTPELDECDVVVPRSKVAEFILFTHRLAKEMNIRIPSFGHAGDGNLHIYVCKDGLPERDWARVLPEAFEKMYQKAKALNGQVSGEHGIGYAKRAYLHHHLGEVQMQLMRSIKQAFDPNHILNPGKIL